jgi:hypothetical protein
MQSHTLSLSRLQQMKFEELAAMAAVEGVTTDELMNQAESDDDGDDQPMPLDHEFPALSSTVTASSSGGAQGNASRSKDPFGSSPHRSSSSSCLTTFNDAVSEALRALIADVDINTAFVLVSGLDFKAMGGDDKVSAWLRESATSPEAIATIQLYVSHGCAAVQCVDGAAAVALRTLILSAKKLGGLSCDFLTAMPVKERMDQLAIDDAVAAATKEQVTASSAAVPSAKPAVAPAAKKSAVAPTRASVSAGSSFSAHIAEAVTSSSAPASKASGTGGAARQNVHAPAAKNVAAVASPQVPRPAPTKPSAAAQKSTTYKAGGIGADSDSKGITRGCARCACTRASCRRQPDECLRGAIHVATAAVRAAWLSG